MTVKEYGSEFDWLSTLPYTKTEKSEFLKSVNAKGFRSGRDALKAAARTYAATHNTVLLPALCCESMVTPFTMNGYKAAFYKLKEDLTADESDVENKITNTTVVVYMSYFGIKPLSDGFLESLRKNFSKAKFIEDRTHNPFYSNERNSFNPDTTVISIRKWLSVADGGFLFTEDELNEDFPVQKTFSDLRKTAMEKKSEFLKTGKEELKTEFRELLNEAAQLLDISPNPYKMTETSAELLSKTDYEKILLQRQENVQSLKNGLQPLVQKGKLRFITNAPEKSTLYFPILLDNRDYVQGKLAAKSVFCPVIWPIPQEAKGVCKNSEYIADNMLAVPCDQRYNENDMLEIVKIIDSVI